MKTQPTEPVEATTDEERKIEALAAIFHLIYQEEAKRQGDVRHPDNYEDLPENVKEYDRVLARYVQRVLAAHRVAAELAEHERVLREEFEPWKAKVERAALERVATVVKKWNFMACSDADGLVAEIRARIPTPTVPDPQTGEK